MDIKTICDLIESRKEELFSLLGDLVRINSENFGDHGNEQACAEYILGLCKELGMESEMYSPLDLENFKEHPDYFPGRNLENRYNVTAKWQGTEDVNRLMLMGHLDTVEIGDPAKWDLDPLSGAVVDGKVYGRGACDDKYALATCLFIIRLLKEAGFVPKKNLLFSAYCDEEIGGSHGAMAAVMRYPCQGILNMDGRKNQAWHCASGGQVVTYRYRVRGVVSSVEKTARAIPIVLDTLALFGQRRREELERNPYYAGTIIPETSMGFSEVHAGRNNVDQDLGVLRMGFYTDKTKEEIWQELAEMDALLQEKLDPLGIDSEGFTAETRFFHYAACDPNSADIRTLIEAVKEATGEDVIVCGSCLSDLSVILKYGTMEAFGFGCGREFNMPGGAHQPNEYIECDTLVDYAKKIAAYVMKMVG